MARGCNRRSGRYHPPPKSTNPPRCSCTLDTEHLEVHPAALFRSPACHRQLPANAAPSRPTAPSCISLGANRPRLATLRRLATNWSKHRHRQCRLASAQLPSTRMASWPPSAPCWRPVSIGSATVITRRCPPHHPRHRHQDRPVQHQAHYQMTVKQNSSETYEALVSIPCGTSLPRSFSSSVREGPWPHRTLANIEVMTLPPMDTLNYPHV